MILLAKREDDMLNDNIHDNTAESTSKKSATPITPFHKNSARDTRSEIADGDSTSKAIGASKPSSRII